MKRDRSKFSAAVLVILLDRDRICVIRRDATGFLDGHFTLPGGVLEEGETLRDAARREAREETGVELTADSMRHVHVLHSRNEGESWFGHFFLVERWIGTPCVTEPDKHSELRWVPFDRLPTPMVPYVGTALHAISLGQPYSEFGWNQ
jgi:8-oxo-dGTP diphosphatase